MFPNWNSSYQRLRASSPDRTNDSSNSPSASRASTCFPNENPSDTYETSSVDLAPSAPHGYGLLLSSLSDLRSRAQHLVEFERSCGYLANQELLNDIDSILYPPREPRPTATPSTSSLDWLQILDMSLAKPAPEDNDKPAPEDDEIGYIRSELAAIFTSLHEQAREITAPKPPWISLLALPKNHRSAFCHAVATLGSDVVKLAHAPNSFKFTHRLKGGTMTSTLHCDEQTFDVVPSYTLEYRTGTEAYFAVHSISDDIPAGFEAGRTMKSLLDQHLLKWSETRVPERLTQVFQFIENHFRQISSEQVF